MKIIISHLTRMRPGYICVAGVDPETGKHIRPVLNRFQLGRDLLRKNGGAFEIGALVDLGATKHVGHKPEIEDYEFSAGNLQYIQRLRPGDFWKYLMQTSENELVSTFGDDLKQRETSCTVDINSGDASLGNLTTADISFLGVNAWGKIRTHISDGQFNPDLSVTDVRFYEDDQKTARGRIVESIACRLPYTGVVLAVGLTRPWMKDGDTAQRHWLQVNNIHLEEDPLGELFEF